MPASVQRIIAEGHHLKGCLMTTFTFPVTSMVVSSLQAALKWSARIGGIRHHSPSTVGSASMSPAVPAVHANCDAVSLPLI